MAQEETQLLLKDLCAGLPYGVMIKDTYSGHYGRLVKIGNTFAYFISELNGNTLDVQFGYVKPYLRPMSSMTKEEKSEWYSFMEKYHGIPDDTVHIQRINDYQDWLNTHHFDHRGLIPMGLALEATKDMYKTE